MSQEDIDKAVKDAEKFAEQDKKAKEAVETKNNADALIFQSEKTLNELGDKVTESEKAEINDAIAKLRETMNSGDTEAIKADTEALEKAFYALSEKLYAQSGAQGCDPNCGGCGNDGVVDADYETVD